MATARAAWGVDVGNRALKAVKLVRDGDGFKVDDFVIIEHETVLSQSGDNRDALIATALAQFVQGHNIKSTPVGIAVSGQQSFARFIALPPVEKNKIPDIVKFEAAQQIPFPLDEVEWSYQLFQNVDSPEVEVGLFAMRSDIVKRVLEAYTSVKLNVNVVQMSPLAVYNAMIHDGKTAEGCTLIVDIGAENTDLIIADGDKVWLRSIQIGGNSFTEAIVRGIKGTSFAKAEEEKRNSATSKHAQTILKLMRPVFDDLVSEIQRSIGFYASTHRESRIAKVLAVGGTLKVSGLQRYLQQKLNLDVEKVEAFTATSPSDAKVAAVYGDNILSATAAYGLALQVMGEAKIGTSLLPSDIKRELAWRDKTPWFIGTAAAFLVGAGLSVGAVYMGRSAYDSAESAQNRSQIADAKTQATKLDGDWTTVQGSGGPEKALIANLNGLTAGRNWWPTLLDDIYAAVPTAPADKVAAGPRGERNQVRIEAIYSSYRDKLGPIPFQSDADFRRNVLTKPMEIAGGTISELGGGGDDQGGTQADPGSDPNTAAAPGNSIKPGFLITVRGVTPNAKGGTYLEQAVVQRLQQIGHFDKSLYHVSRAVTVSVTKIKQNSTRISAMENAWRDYLTMFGDPDQAKKDQDAKTQQPLPPGLSAPPGMGGTAGGGMMDARAYADPLTGEDMREDWEFVVLLVVEDGPPTPEAPPAPPPPPPAP